MKCNLPFVSPIKPTEWTSLHNYEELTNNKFYLFLHCEALNLETSCMLVKCSTNEIHLWAPLMDLIYVE